ncbi:MAG TPA: PPOX class F420-dependent oxidoreductase [Solirubrobacteraceae bacterium]|nr:PPOX class F420-dependent oxidoreductase [Solirubrobacteraceae bacterium]
MATLTDSEVRKLLSEPNHAVVSTLNPDGTILNTVAWISAENGSVAVNSARGRRWPTNLERDPRITVLVYEQGNPYNYVEIRGRANATTKGADEHINALSKKYIDQDEYPFRQPGEERIKFVIQPDHVRHQKQG